MRIAMSAIGALATCAVSASAQLISAGTGILEWQALTSHGWESGLVNPETPIIHVRLVASWQVPAEHSYFGQTFMDVVVEGADTSDSIQNLHILRPPVNGNPGICTWWGSIMKIDLPGDTLAPGAGSLWVNPHQSIFEGYVYDNPLPLYEFDLVVGSLERSRTISSVHRAMGTGRYMQVVDADSLTGASYLVQTEIQGLMVVPAPCAATILTTAIVRCRRQQSERRDSNSRRSA